MKRIASTVLCIVLIFSLSACGNKTIEPDKSVQIASSQSETAESADNASNESATDRTAHHILVAYFSATGSTKAVAETIASRISADTFEITPKEPYTLTDLNYNDKNSRVSLEHNNLDGRNVELVTTTPDDFNGFDIVFVGYPIWWGDAAWVIDNFVKGNDFTGKTVIPFCTSVSSDIGESASNLAKMAGTGTWLEGKRFSGSASEDEISEWLTQLGL
jgi:Flavodoxins